MEIVVIDLEFNQSFDFGNGSKVKTTPECSFEIIQIGAVKLNSNYEIIDNVCLTIKPQIYTKLHPYVRDITGLTDAVLNNGMTFEQAYKLFIEFIGTVDAVIGVWGNNDIKELYRNILFYKLNDKLLTRKYVNIQQMAAVHLKKPNGVTIGLKNAVEQFNIDMDIEFHDALNDAIYTAKIFHKIKKAKFPINTYELEALERYVKEKKTGINTKHLVSIIESDLGRKITNSEKDAFIKVYKLGQRGVLDKR